MKKKKKKKKTLEGIICNIEKRVQIPFLLVFKGRNLSFRDAHNMSYVQNIVFTRLNFRKSP
jgi:hypothetical protein